MDPVERIGHVLSSYVTHGKMDFGDQFDEDFSAMAGALPAMLRSCPSTLYRVFLVDPTHAGALARGEPVQLAHRSFGSWSTCEDASRSLMRLRAHGAEVGMMLALVRRDVDPSRCVVDVTAVYEHLGWNCGEVGEWSNYVEWEREVVLSQDEDLCRIAPVDLVCLLSPDDPEVLAPRPGERVWDPSAEDFAEVEELLDVEQADPDAWTVLLHDGREAVLAWDRCGQGWRVDGLVPARRHDPAPGGS